MSSSDKNSGNPSGKGGDHRAESSTNQPTSTDRLPWPEVGKGSTGFDGTIHGATFTGTVHFDYRICDSGYAGDQDDVGAGRVYGRIVQAFGFVLAVASFACCGMFAWTLRSHPVEYVSEAYLPSGVPVYLSYTLGVVVGFCIAGIGGSAANAARRRHRRPWAHYVVLAVVVALTVAAMTWMLAGADLADLDPLR